MPLEPPVDLQSPLSQQSDETEQVGTRIAGFYLSLGLLGPTVDLSS